MTQTLRRRWWQVVLLGIALAVLVFVGWASIIPSPMPEAIAALQPDAGVSVETAPWLVFQPVGRQPDVGLILYPGGRVDHRAYAPAARAIAAGGYLVAVVPMPLHLAVFGVDRAKRVIEAFPAVQHWAIGGHSLGGSMAAQFARRHPDLVQGLALWASYPAAADDLTASSLKVTSISGTQDGLSTPAKIEASRRLLPTETRFVAIEGANHAQFGWYGAQSGDNQATITRQAQQEQVVAATVALLAQLR
jgi:pimeloyl-ACP methyl ester carboxylesterase